MKKLLIIGAGGHGKVAADIAEKMNRWSEICFLDDNQIYKEIIGKKVIDEVKNFKKYADDFDMFVAIGNNALRKKIHSDISEFDSNIVSLIHPSAIISNYATIKKGVLISPGACINSDTIIGEGSIINTLSSVDHDSIIESFVHLSPGAKLGGNVRIGSGTWIGMNTSVINGINITSNCIIGAGSTVVKDISKVGTYVGLPARRLR